MTNYSKIEFSVIDIIISYWFYSFCRAKIFEDIDRLINSEELLNRVVYDFDAIVKDGGDEFHGGSSYYANHDVER